MPAPVTTHLKPERDLAIHHPVFITDLSVTVTSGPMTNLVPYNVSDYPNCDPLEAERFHAAKTEAERIGMDKYGQSWPMIRAQRIHNGDTDEGSAITRRLIGNARFGSGMFIPIEVPNIPTDIQRRDSGY